MSPPRSIIRKFSWKKDARSTSKALISSTLVFRPRPNMHSLPTEIYARILKNVSIDDLIAFRSTCRTCHRLLCSGEIIRRWLEENGDKHQSSLDPPPASPSFLYLLEQRSRYQTANATAKLIAKYIRQEILRYTLQRLDVFPTRSRDEVLQTTTQDVQVKLVPLLLTVQHYLEHFSEAVTGQFTPLDQEPLEKSFSSERALLEFYDSDHVLQVHKFWHFLYWLLNQLLSPSMDGPPRVNADNGCSWEPYNRCQLRLMLVLGNITALKSLLIADTPKQRLRTISMYFRRLDPDLSLVWQRRWRAMVFGRHEIVKAAEAREVLNLRLAAGNVWIGGARALLIERGQLPRNTSEEIGAPWQALDFLFDVCGYDALQTPPSMLQLSRVLKRPVQ